ncbi:MAG: hypothetical protein NXI21_01595 [Alphaproteobacteria bacterium]|nr:hypothetical protein [Alphaproteobacteria bacterium]
MTARAHDPSDQGAAPAPRRRRRARPAALAALNRLPPLALLAGALSLSLAALGGVAVLSVV